MTRISPRPPPACALRLSRPASIIGGGSCDANSADGADLVHQDEDIVHQHEIVQFKLQP
jgi:hypothetical protein